MPKNTIGETPFSKSSMNLANKLMTKETLAVASSQAANENKPVVNFSSATTENPEKKISTQFKNDIAKAKKKAEGPRNVTSIAFTNEIIDKLDRIIYKRIQTFEGFKKKPSRSSIISEAINNLYEKEII